jgi:hypothetical protein
MRRLLLPCLFFIGVAVCDANPSLQPVTAANAEGLGPTMNKGLNYDGTNAGVSVVNNSQGKGTDMTVLAHCLH